MAACDRSRASPERNSGFEWKAVSSTVEDRQAIEDEVAGSLMYSPVRSTTITIEEQSSMPSSVKAVFGRYSRQVGTLFTLCILGVIGYLGHHTGWSLSFDHGHEQSPHPKRHTAHPSVPVHDTNPLCVHYKSPEAIAKSGITTVPAAHSELSEYVQANGTVGYHQRRVARLSSRVTGTVWRIDKHLGDAVRSGDVLLIIEAVDVGRMKAEFLSELIATEMNEETLQRLEQIPGAVAERQIRQARAELRASRVRLLNAEQALVNLGFKVRMEEFEKLPETKRAEVIHFIGLPKEMADQFDPDTTTSNLVPIFAPFDGVIIGGDAGLGEVVEPAKHLIQIADIGRMWINLEVQKEDVPKLKVGQPIEFQVDGIVEPMKSQIDWISTQVNEETRTLRVRAEIENRVVHPDEPSETGQRLLRANTYGTGRILVRTQSNALVVPNECIQSDGTNDIVFVKTDDTTFEGRVVQCGITNGQQTEIEGAIQSGEQVVKNGSHILKSQVLLSQSESESP